MPKYEEIANVLRERIRSKEYPPNSFLPNQITLVEEFGASRMTIKKAINILAMEGLVYSQRGAG
ncbi:TPA: GntR family transcriptional regulator, partial [Enterococcus hirae]